jgi:hydrogenase maturation protein HypF
MFRLPGGEAAVREPRRAAMGLLFEIFGREFFPKEQPGTPPGFSKPEMQMLFAMLENGLNSPRTSSAGRLFDAVASLIGLRQHSAFEGQAAMDLEFAIHDKETNDAYPLCITGAGLPFILDWEVMIAEILSDLGRGVSVGEISAKFHNGLALSVVAVAQKAGEERVVLTGGCFQNKYLLEKTVSLLREYGFQPFWHQRIPTNDGGIAAGQVAAAMHDLSCSRTR